MSTNVLQFIYNADGSLLDKVNPFIASNNQAANNIQIIAPFPNSDSVSINFYLRNARLTNYTQYTRLLKDNNGESVYGKDIVSPSKPYYQLVKDWNVWQIPISSKALRAISKYHAGKVDISCTFREYKNFLIDETMEFKGTFGSPKSSTRGDIPLTASDGDFYRCDYLDFYSQHAQLSFTLMDLAIWDELESRWIKGSSYEEALPTPSTEIGVDPSIFGTAIEDVEGTTTEQILDRVSDLESIIMGAVPEEVISQMFVRRNLNLYYQELQSLYEGDKLYIERDGSSFKVDISNLKHYSGIAKVDEDLSGYPELTNISKTDKIYVDDGGIPSAISAETLFAPIHENILNLIFETNFNYGNIPPSNSRVWFKAIDDPGSGFSFENELVPGYIEDEIRDEPMMLGYSEEIEEEEPLLGYSEEIEEEEPLLGYSENEVIDNDELTPGYIEEEI